MNGLAGSCAKAECYHFTYYKDPLNPFIGRGHFTAQRKPILSLYECLLFFMGLMEAGRCLNLPVKGYYQLKTGTIPNSLLVKFPAVVRFLGEGEEKFIYITVVVTWPVSL